MRQKGARMTTRSAPSFGGEFQPRVRLKVSLARTAEGAHRNALVGRRFRNSPEGFLRSHNALVPGDFLSQSVIMTTEPLPAESIVASGLVLSGGFSFADTMTK